MLDNHSINSLIFLCDTLISTAVSHETLQGTHRQCLLLCDMHLWRNAFLHNYSHISRVTFSIYVFYCDRIIEPNNLKRKKKSCHLALGLIQLSKETCMAKQKTQKRNRRLSYMAFFLLYSFRFPLYGLVMITLRIGLHCFNNAFRINHHQAICMSSF